MNIIIINTETPPQVSVVLFNFGRTVFYINTVYYWSRRRRSPVSVVVPFAFFSVQILAIFLKTTKATFTKIRGIITSIIR